MAFLNPSPVVPLPGIMHIVHRYLLLECRGNAAKEDMLRSLLAPPPFSGDSVAAAITAGIALGLLVRDGDVVRLASPTKTGQDVESFRGMIREAVFAPPHISDVIGSDTGARDLARALAWFLRQDGYRPIEDYGGTGRRTVEALEERQYGKGRIFVNDARWLPFVRWARFLGFLREEPNGVTPDATEALRWVVRRLAADGSARVEAPEFLRSVASIIPVVEGGSTRVEVDAVSRDPSGESGTVDTTLSHALLRLEADGELTLEERADAGQLARSMRLPAGASRSFSHIQIAGAT